MIRRCGNCRFWGPREATAQFPDGRPMIVRQCQHPSALVFGMNDAATQLTRPWSIQHFGCWQWEAGESVAILHDAPAGRQ